MNQTDLAARIDPFRRATWLVWVVALAAGCGEFDRDLTLVKPRLAVDLEIAEAFAEQMDEEADLRITLVDNPDPEQPGLAAVKSGRADLALVANTEAFDPAVATVVPLYPTVLHIAYRLQAGGELPEERDLISQLSSRGVYAGPSGSASRMLLEAAARRGGLDPERINYASEEETCADIMVVYAPILPDVPDRIGRCGEYRLLSLGNPADVGTGAAVDSVSLLNPRLKPFVIPAGTYGALTPEPVLTLAVDKLLVARADVAEGVIYDLLKEILRLKPALSAKTPGLFHQLTDRFDITGSAFVLHPGALAYVQRDEPNVYERYSGIAEVLVTLIIGLVSGTYAIYRILTIRRKNRIDAFCREALDLRDAAFAEDTAAARAAALTELRALQERAYAALIDERLAADESFRIFITLSNDLMNDLRGSPRSGSG